MKPAQILNIEVRNQPETHIINYLNDPSLTYHQAEHNEISIAPGLVATLTAEAPENVTP